MSFPIITIQNPNLTKQQTHHCQKQSSNRSFALELINQFFKASIEVLIFLPVFKIQFSRSKYIINLIFLFACITFMEQNLEEAFKIDPVQSFELKYDSLNVTANIQEKVDIGGGKSMKQPAQKLILNKCSGIFQPYTFNAIVGPSGCGKTTMLNLLSGRLLSTNLVLEGKMYVNGERIYNINQFGQYIGYVMQQDLLVATFTPRESFHFIANLRLPHATQEEKTSRVQQLIKALGLTKCSDTYVGNALIRGVSGGQKKRTSIGIQLLINPSILFLDEPTTGLDSTTALHVMKFLNKIAKSGRTVISTIHQPSSQIFGEFDRLLIMVQGNIVYQGPSKQSMDYFGSIGFPVKKHSNPTDYYMKIMNKEGLAMQYIEKQQEVDDAKIKQQFEQRVTFFQEQYKNINHDFSSKVTSKIQKCDGQGSQTFLNQVYYVFKRAVKKQLRNPLDLKLKILQMVVQAILCIILYYKTTDSSFAYLQNISGCLFFILMVNTFGGIIANVATFSSERSIFIRQRMSNSYSTLAYYVGKSLACIPIQWFLPLLFMVIAYFPSNLNNSAGVFFLAVLTLQLTYWMAASYGMILSTVIKSFDVVMALVPVLIIPLMLVAGFFTNLNEVPKFFYWMEYISPFKYGFQAIIQNQFRHKIDCGNGQYCDILQTKYKFPQPFWLNLLLLFLIGFIFRIISFIGLVIISNPKRVKLPIDGQTRKITCMDKAKYCLHSVNPMNCCIKPPAQNKPSIEHPPTSSGVLQPPPVIQPESAQPIIVQSRIAIMDSELRRQIEGPQIQPSRDNEPELREQIEEPHVSSSKDNIRHMESIQQLRQGDSDNSDSVKGE